MSQQYINATPLHAHVSNVLYQSPIVPTTTHRIHTRVVDKNVYVQTVSTFDKRLQPECTYAYFNKETLARYIEQMQELYEELDKAD